MLVRISIIAWLLFVVAVQAGILRRMPLSTDSSYAESSNVRVERAPRRAHPPSLNVYCLLHAEICNRMSLNTKRQPDF
ncbi:unnamed protein product, partial [Mesorhabditis spiculigera]